MVISEVTCDFSLSGGAASGADVHLDRSDRRASVREESPCSSSLSHLGPIPQQLDANATASATTTATGLRFGTGPSGLGWTLSDQEPGTVAGLTFGRSQPGEGANARVPTPKLKKNIRFGLLYLERARIPLRKTYPTWPLLIRFEGPWFIPRGPGPSRGALLRPAGPDSSSGALISQAGS